MKKVIDKWEVRLSILFLFLMLGAGINNYVDIMIVADNYTRFTVTLFAIIIVYFTTIVPIKLCFLQLKKMKEE